MAAPFDLTYEAPLGPVPAWLSYRISPTATVVVPYTVATLAANGAPTAITGQATLTRYATQLLELPITVTVPRGADGQQQISLGPAYTTAGGEDPTVARVLGGTELVTLDATSSTRISPSRTESSELPTAETSRGTQGPRDGFRRFLLCISELILMIAHL
ncbi:uncharacterized protein JCM15063_004021 [Sporobolomyces koalae]|uniref:uncharacterized protein n=1 Tax=Sporobolomyces koalae TaxID=500713 RepID=UPI00317BA106